MSRKNKNKPTESELEILQIIWEEGPSSVRSVNEILNAKRKTGYTTTLKIMQIMLDKNLLSRNEESRIHIYSTVAEKEEIQARLLNNFLMNTFSGSAHSLVMQALGNHKPSRKELEQIKSLIKDLENNKDGASE